MSLLDDLTYASTPDQVVEATVAHPQVKTCARCGLSKDLVEFNGNRAAKDGKRSECRQCQSEYSKSYYLANADARCAAAKTQYAINSETINAKNSIYQSANRESINAKTRERHKNDPKKAHAAHLKARYGIGIDDYALMLEQQLGLCANPECFNEPSTNRRLDVDHDHSCCPGSASCGKCIRGLLCRSCNQALGFIHDDPAKLRGLADYLERTCKT